MRQPIDEDLNVELPDLADVSASSFQGEKGKNICIAARIFSNGPKKNGRPFFPGHSASMTRVQNFLHHPIEVFCVCVLAFYRINKKETDGN